MRDYKKLAFVIIGILVLFILVALFFVQKGLYKPERPVYIEDPTPPALTREEKLENLDKLLPVEQKTEEEKNEDLELLEKLQNKDSRTNPNTQQGADQDPEKSPEEESKANAEAEAAATAEQQRQLELLNKLSQ